ncbi:MAG: type I 3-dehydroquinate dehydratase [Methanocellales archaeon]
MLQITEPKIVASITSADQIKKAEQSGADIIEARLDLFKKIEKAEIKSTLPIIATNRPKEEGGGFEGSEEERIKILLSILDLANAVDIELKSRLRDLILKEARERELAAIVSYHNFYETPSNSKLRKILKKALSVGNIAKVAVMAKSYEDVIRMQKLSLEFKGKPICIIAMGSLGRHFRAIAPIYGSLLVYGSIDEKTAPGQLTVWELKELRKLLW